MAFGVKKIFPIDTRPGVAVGITIPFNAPAVFNSSYTTQDAIRNNLINFFLTNKTERYLNPEFGGDLRQFLFDQITTDTTDNINNYLRQQIASNFSNVEVRELIINPDPDYNTINISIKYNIINTGITDQIQLEFT